MRLTLPAIVVTIASLAAGAQGQAVRTPFRAEANYIRVDMYPTLGGRPIDDLRESEVEILDQGERQTIDRFKHVLVAHPLAPPAPQAAGGGEPATVADARAPSPDGRARLFVLFLDSNHVDANLSRNIGQKLATALNTLITSDDLIAVMTPDMRAEDLTFTRRTKAVEEILKTVWGTRDRWVMANPQEAEYAICYPPSTSDLTAGGIAQDMTLRRREKLSLDALEALVDHLGTLREERKAVITISNGWRLFGENTLDPSAEKAKAPSAGLPPTQPRTGRLTPEDRPNAATTKCEADRFALGQLRHEQRFREILERANRTNTSFYPIDPRGVAVFDEDILPVAGTGLNLPIGLVEDRERLAARRTSLLTMAESTDGLAIVNTRDLDAGLRRIGEDLSSYYLAGFRSTRKLDGKFHRLTVRVKRPGVEVRARRGYLAATSKRASNTGAAPVPALTAASFTSQAGTTSARLERRPAAPLAPDYLIQLTAGAETAMAAIRVLP